MSNASSEIDMVISKCVDEIWGKYDTDGNGNLDKEETKHIMDYYFQVMKDTAGTHSQKSSL